MMISTIWFLSALLAVAQAAPQRSGKNQQNDKFWQKRQTIDLVLTETHVEVFSETLTETFTETLTATEITSIGTSTAAVTTFTAGPVHEVHTVGDIPNPDPAAQSILFLPLEGPDASGASSTTASDTTAPITDGAVSSSDSPSSTVPTQTDSGATSTAASTFDGGANPAFAVHTPVVKGPLLSAYYPDWAASDLPPENIDMTRLDWIDFAFATATENFDLAWDDPDSSPDILNRVVAAAHAKGTKVKLSIGGWGGSKYFSSACASTSSRSTFVNNIVKVYNQFKLDGIDIDWEYPGQQGEGNNAVSPQDSANFLAMLRLLRKSLPSAARITAAVQDVPFADANGNPLTDVSAFAAVLDWVNIMNYDVFGSSNNPGPNAPLSNACKDSSQPQNNAESAIAAWSDAKFPASRLMLGVPAYGYLSPSSSTQLQHRKRSLMASGLVRRQDSGDSAAQNDTTSTSSALPDASTDASSMTSSTSSSDSTTSASAPAEMPSAQDPLNALQGQSASAAASTPGTVTLKSIDGTTNGGQLQFASLISQGALLPVRVVNGSSAAVYTTFVAIGGFTRFWDACSSTPFLSSPYADQVVTYDDPQSLGLKAAYAKDAKILGTAVWDLSGDTPQWDLMNALRRGLGKSV